MFELAALITYIAVVIGLFLIPGPSVLLVITRTVQGGRKVGVAPAWGWRAATCCIHWARRWGYRRS
ncbi:hypothetical protein [Pseudomonas allii]|uniref:hypothetical protein n=1 Tax=Pseudomonas allii TaxID=2740531 RepID=UPI001F03EA95|nr:hypothetical protein [Pseudomonas allii]